MNEELQKNSKVSGNHQITIRQRSGGTITGVLDIEEFDSTQIKLHTSMGQLLIKGKGIHVKRLNLEKGEADLEGSIDSIVYLDRKGEPAKRRWLFA